VAIFRTLNEGDGEARLKGIDELAKLDRTRLNALELKALDEKAKALKVELGQAAFERGRAAHRRDDFKTAASELKRYLALDPDGADALQSSFMLGTALVNLKDFAGAVPHLERFVAGGKGAKGFDYAFFVLGQAHEALGHADKAMDAYRRGTAECPGSEYIVAMQQRFRMAQHAALAGQGGSAQPAAAPAAAPAPVPAAPVPAPAQPQPAPKSEVPAPPAPPAP
jgi:tetratricopeptide (TPR) repeat protein